MNNSKLQHALHYASLGIPVLPLHYITADGTCSCGETKPCKKGKHPLGRLVPHGLTDATTDEATIRQWFEGKPYNIGICTGTESRIFVLDRDDRDGGDQSLATLEDTHSKLPATISQRTGNGVHYLFNLPPDQPIKNSAKKIAPGLDIRGIGGYIVAAPSVHENGKTYTWLDCELPTREQIVDAPKWLLDLLLQDIKPLSGTIPPRAANSPNGAFMAGAFNWPDKISDGAGREDFIIRAAGRLRGKGNDQADIERILLDYNRIHIDPPLDDEAILDRARRYETANPIQAANDSDWPEPEEVKATLPPVPPFDLRLLPKAFRDWVADIAERMQCPVEYLAVGAMVAAGAAVGNRVGVQPKQHDTGWVEVPNLWGAVVGRPGVMKSPALAQVLLPLRRLESAAQASFTATRAQYEVDRMMYEAAKKHIEAQIKKGATILLSQLPVQPDEPQPQRYLLNDATYQKLGAVLGGNPHGVLVFQDELSGLLMRLDTDGQESSRAFYLEAWNGQQSYTFDRMERGTVRIPRLCFSLLGGLQPSKLREYLRSAVYGGKGDDGLAQRLQMLVFPDISPDWTQVDRLPDLAAASIADDVFTRLGSLDPLALGARQHYLESIPVFAFDEAAQALFNRWWSILETSLRQNNNHPALESHISKYRKLVPALALLDHLIVGSGGDIGVTSLKRAILWQKFLLAHAKRAYAAVTSATMDSAKALSKHIERGALNDGFTVREVYRHNWSLLTTTKEAVEAIEVLVDLGWLRAVRDERINPTDGRPTVRHYINPRLKAAA